MYLLDTNILSHIIRFPEGVAAARVHEIDNRLLATSVIVAMELRYGAKRRGSERLTARMEDVLDRVTVLPLIEGVDHIYALIRVDLERRGQPIGPHDMLIAAHALFCDAALVTDNVNEFERVDGLAIENWLRPD